MSRSPLRSWQVVQWLFVLPVLVAPRPARAQTSGPKWDVEFHVGSMRSPETFAGTNQLPPVGASFLVQGNPPTPLSSRQVPSWFFGDGAVLFNQSSATVGASGIKSIDSVLTSFGGVRKRGQEFGVRIGRRIGERYGFEIGIESSKTPMAFSDSTVAALNASSASFVTGWNSLIQAEQVRITNKNAVTSPVVNSHVDFENEPGKQYLLTVAAKVRIIKHGPVIPYVVVGGGAAISPGGEMEAALDGHYEFINFGAFKAEDNNLSIEYKEKPIAPLVVYGAGVDGNLGKHAGWRFDFRALSRKNATTTTINSFSNRAFPPGQPGSAFAFFTDPAIQFSNTPNFPSSLTGFLDDTETFHGTGRSVQTMMTAGVFLRY